MSGITSEVFSAVTGYARKAIPVIPRLPVEPINVPTPLAVSME